MRHLVEDHNAVAVHDRLEAGGEKRSQPQAQTHAHTCLSRLTVQCVWLSTNGVPMGNGEDSAFGKVASDHALNASISFLVHARSRLVHD